MDENSANRGETCGCVFVLECVVFSLVDRLPLLAAPPVQVLVQALEQVAQQLLRVVLATRTYVCIRIRIRKNYGDGELTDGEETGIYSYFIRK